MATPGKNIPVKVVVDRSPRAVAPASAPVIHPKRKVVAKAPVFTPPHPKPRGLEHMPVQTRKQWMWTFVAVGTFAAVILWGMSLGAELRQTDNPKNPFTEVAQLFRSFKFRTPQTTTPQREEIQKLEEQVFPQLE